MKNIIIILLILILPIAGYLFLDRNKAASDIALAENRPTFMVFTSTMCLDCQRVKKELGEIENDYKDKVNIVKINALEKKGDAKKLVKKYNITLVPTLIFMDSNNNTTYRTEGYMSKEEMKEKLENLLNG